MMLKVFIFCVWHAEMVQEYIAKSKWSSTMAIRCISSSSCTSAGDALRELDSLGVIRSDPFVLISGDVISNIDLKKAIIFHNEKRKTDPDAVMTIALKTIRSAEVGIKSLFDDLIVGIDQKSKQVLLFDDSCEKSSLSIPKQLIIDHPNVSFRTDFLDCHVDICSPEFMLQLSDNFDYQDIRHDFIRNEVVNWELGKHIYGYEIDTEYAARVHDPRTYHSISKDIVTRWTYPMVPDSQLIKGSEYVHHKNYNYRGNHCVVARSITIGECNVIGHGSSVGENSVVNKSIIGKNCKIGDNVIIINSHVWDGNDFYNIVLYRMFE
jgi:translation initiation factor eIF-2B subunit epsilon